MVLVSNPELKKIPDMKLNRILLKLSGEALEGSQGYGIDPLRLAGYADEIRSVVDEKIQVAVVMGGGNIFRGLPGTAAGIDRVQGDYMGMLATIINSMALQSALEKRGLRTKLFSAIAIDPVCETMSRRRAIGFLKEGTVVIIAGGTGNPYFTTDTAAALRAVEIQADAIVKGTRVDGVYSADPEKDRKAVKFDRLSFDEAYKKSLKVMDLTAFTLCKENKLPVIVIDINQKGILKKLIRGEKVGTIVS